MAPRTTRPAIRLASPVGIMRKTHRRGVSMDRKLTRPIGKVKGPLPRSPIFSDRAFKSAATRANLDAGSRHLVQPPSWIRRLLRKNSAYVQLAGTMIIMGLDPSGPIGSEASRSLEWTEFARFCGNFGARGNSRRFGFVSSCLPRADGTASAVEEPSRAGETSASKMCPGREDRPVATEIARAGHLTKGKHARNTCS